MQLIKKFYRPKILLIGTPQSGKTNLLLATSIQSSRWKPLLERLHTFQMPRSLHHLLIVIDVPSLLNSTKETIAQLSKQLQRIQKHEKMIPVSIVISKCDKLDGFSEMFDDLNTQERQQAFGITVSNTFHTDFLILMNRLKARRLHRLHREQSHENRQKIFAFPTQLSRLLKPLKTLITNLPFSDTLPLQDVYFTSVSDRRSFFVDGMFDAIITQRKPALPVKYKDTTERLLAFPIAAAIIFGFTILWQAGYDQTIRIIDQVQTTLATKPTNVPNNLPWLSDLNILSNVLERIQQKQRIRYHWVGLLQTRQLYEASKKEYQLLLQQQFTPYIKSILLTQIQLGMKNNKLALFDALKTYLSTSNAQHYNKNIIMNWYRIYWKTLYPNNLALQSTFQHHLFLLMESNKPLWQPDTELVRQAQTLLQKLSLTDLAFLELQGEYESLNVSIFPGGNLEGVSIKNATVPIFFSTKHFKEIFSDKIPHIGKILAKGNWVLGTTKGKIISSKQQATIAKKIRTMYLSYYTNAWANTITGIQLTPATSNDDVIQRIDNVLNENSSLTKLLKLVIGNARLNGGSTNKNLTAVKTYLNKKGSYASIQKVLTSLKNEIQKTQKANNTNKASYLQAIQRLKTRDVSDPIGRVFIEANNHPKPIRSWLNTIATSARTVQLQHAKSYLNSIWKTIVLPVYRNEIENRYPVFKDSRENISIRNFKDFFGPNGTVGAFFVYYLQPFVNTSKNYWTWKSINGVSLDIPQETLNTFIRASIIQQMFFTDNRNRPSFRFILAPLRLSGNLEKFTINIGGQIYNLTQKTQSTKQIYWPGPDPSFVSLQFLTNDEKIPTSNYDGPWSWFRMLDANTLQTSADPREFILTIQSGNYSTSLRVIAESRVNPMVPGVIAKYRCPDQF